MLYKIGAVVAKGYILLLIMAAGGFAGANIFGMFGTILSEVFSDLNRAPDNSITRWLMHGEWFAGIAVALYGRIMQQRKKAKSSTNVAEQDQTKRKKPSTRTTRERIGKREGILTSSFWGGVIGGSGGLALGLSSVLLWFSLTYSPLSPQGWVEFIQAERRRDATGRQRRVITTDHPVAVYAVGVPLVLGVVSGGVIGGTAAAITKVKGRRQVTRPLDQLPAEGVRNGTMEYTTLAMFRPDKNGRRRLRISTDPDTIGTVSEQVGEAEKPRFLGSLWQGARLLETALKEMDANGWELLSHSFDGPSLGRFTGTAVLRRPSSKANE